MSNIKNNKKMDGRSNTVMKRDRKKRDEAKSVLNKWRSKDNEIKKHGLTMKMASHRYINGHQREVGNESEIEVNAEELRANIVACASTQAKMEDTETLLINTFSLSATKYVQNSSSSDSEASFEEQNFVSSSCGKLQAEEAYEKMVDENKLLTFGMLYFVVQIKSKTKKEFTFKLEKIKSFDKNIPQVNIINTKDEFYLCSIETRSTIKKFTIQLWHEEHFIKQSQPIIFSEFAFISDINLSYDFENMTDINLTAIESYLISNILSCDEIKIKLINLFNEQEKDSIIKNQKINEEVYHFVLKIEIPSQINYLLLFLCSFFQNQKNKFGICNPEQIFEKQLIIIFMNYFEHFTPRIKDNETFKIIYYEKISSEYWHLIAAMEYEKKKKKSEIFNSFYSLFDFNNKFETKIINLIEFNFSCNKINIFLKLMHFLNENDLEIKAFSFSILYKNILIYLKRDSFYVESCLLIIKYFKKLIVEHERSNFVITKLIEMFYKETFDNEIEISKNNEKNENLFKEIFSNIKKIEASFNEVKNFLEICEKFHKNKIYSGFVQEETIKSKVLSYFKEINLNFNRKNSLEKDINAGINLFTYVFIENKISWLKVPQNLLTDFIIYLKKFKENDNVKKSIIQLYYNVLKKNNPSFYESYLFEISEEIKEFISKLSFFEALKLLNENFDENILNSETKITLFDSILRDIILKHFFDETQWNEESHLAEISFELKWHNEFRYKRYINEALVSYKLEHINEITTEIKKQKQKLILQSEIQRFVADEQMKDYLLSIIAVDMLVINYETIKNLMIEKDKINILCLIMAKDKKKKESIEENIKLLFEDIIEHNISYETLQKMLLLGEREKIMVDKITSNCPEFLQKAYLGQENAKKYLEQLEEHIKFILYAKEKYNITEEIEELNLLRTYKKKFLEISMKEHRDIEIMKRCDPKVLQFYRFKSFYNLQDNLKNISFSLFIEENNKIARKYEDRIKKIYHEFKKGHSELSDLLFFEPSTITIEEFERQLRVILLEDDEEKEKQEKSMFIIEIKKIFQYLQDINNIQSKLLSIDYFIKKFEQEDKKMDDYLIALIDFSVDIKQKLKKTNVKAFDLYFFHEKFKHFKDKLWEYKINFENDELLYILNVLRENSENIVYFKNLDHKISDLKEFVQLGVENEKNHITYDEIESCEEFLKFDKEFYSKKFQSFKEFILKLRIFINKKPQLGYHLKNLLPKKYEFCEQDRRLNNEGRVLQLTLEGVFRKSCFYFIREIHIEFFVEIEIKDEHFDNGNTNIKKRMNKLEFEHFRNEALIYLASLQSEQKKSIETLKKIKEIELFKKIVRKCEEIVTIHEELFSLGYFFIEVQEIKINFESEKNLEEFDNELTYLNSLWESWKSLRYKILNVHYKAAFIQGKRYINFFKILADPTSENYSLFSEITNAETIKKFKLEHKIEINVEKKFSAEKMQEYIELFFSELAKKENINSEEIYPGIIDLIIENNEKCDNILCLGKLEKEKIANLEFNQILECTDEISFSDVRMFIEMALRDTNKEYFLFGFQYLNHKQQNFMINIIKEYIKTSKESSKLKLCLVGDSEIQQIYKFFKLSKEFNIKEYESNAVAVNENIIKEKIKNAIRDKFFVVQSKEAGYGKTQWILNEGKYIFNQEKDKEEKKTCFDEAIFFPLAGEIKSLDLFERLEAFKNKALTLMQKEQKRVAIIIQIHSLEYESLNIVNKFLTELIIYRKYKQDANIVSIDEKCPIFIELENVTKTKIHVKGTGNEIFYELPNSLPILKTVLEDLEFGEQFQKDKIYKMLQFPEPLRISKEFAEELYSIHYMLKHLIFLKTKKIATEEIENYEEFVQIFKINKENAILTAPKNVNEEIYLLETHEEILKEYFFNHFSPESPPSLYMFNYFKSLLIENCRIFSKSYFFSVDNLKIIDAELEKYNKKLHEQLQILKNIRIEFFSVLVQNAVEFIQKSILLESFSHEDKKFADKLNKFSLLILPNTDEESFSFIYNDPNKVPPIIKTLLVLQDVELFKLVGKQTVNQIFERENLHSLQIQQPKKFNLKIEEILRNISGKLEYKIEENNEYVINIDNFLKMCLIVQRMRVYIPIVIMGEAGMGKTALLRHIAVNIYQDYFLVYNIHAGIDYKGLKNIIEDIKIKYEENKRKNTNLDIKKQKRLWIFFDEFNTTREIGLLKEIILEHKFEGEKLECLEKSVLMGACNPYREKKITIEEQFERYTKTDCKNNELAFDVRPLPQSFLECLWNYGALKEHEYKKYILQMLRSIEFNNKDVPEFIVKMHLTIEKNLGHSSVSLRDIERFKRLYNWFFTNLTENFINKDRNMHKNHKERVFIMTFYFCYLLRFKNEMRQTLKEIVVKELEISLHIMEEIIKNEKEDFCERINYKDQGCIAKNESFNENIYSCFVCVCLKIPLLIVGAPGCSKTLSLRILTNINNLYAKPEKRIDSYLQRYPEFIISKLQGSEMSTSKEIEKAFEYSRKLSREKKNALIIFDEIGLAEKSLQNPLKRLHSYLEINPYSSSENTEFRVSFIGLSNTLLDLSKMSRMLVLKRADPGPEDLNETAKCITESILLNAEFQHEVEKFQIKEISYLLSKTYFNFQLSEVNDKNNSFPHFFSLRDFYCLIKDFVEFKVSEITNNKKKKEYEMEFNDCVLKAIFKNFNGREGSVEKFKKIFIKESNYKFSEYSSSNEKLILKEILNSLKSTTGRYPMAIIDENSLSYLIEFVKNEFEQGSETILTQVRYVEGSPFSKDIQNNEYFHKFLAEFGALIEKPNKAILYELNESVNTALYDFFNKLYTTINNTKFCSLLTKADDEKGFGFNYKRVNSNFSCLYIVKEADLKKIESPLLSRFEKYHFRSEKIINNEVKIKEVSEKIERFFFKLENNNKQKIFREKLFVNVSHASIVSLILKQCLFEKNNFEEIYKRSLRQLIMNSSSKFAAMSKSAIFETSNLENEIIINALNEKNTFQITKKSPTIIFSNSDKYWKENSEKENEKDSKIYLDFSFILSEQHLEDLLKPIYENPYSKEIYFKFPSKYCSKINYFISSIEKIENIWFALFKEILTKEDDEELEIEEEFCLESFPTENKFEKKKYEHEPYKKLFFIFNFKENDIELSNEELLSDNNEKEKISYINKFEQVFDELSLKQEVYEQDEFFTEIFLLPDFLKYLLKSFSFKYENKNSTNFLFIDTIKKVFENTFFCENCKIIIKEVENIKYEITKDIFYSYIKTEKKTKDFFIEEFAKTNLSSILIYYIKDLFSKESLISFDNQLIFKLFTKNVFEFNEKDENLFRIIRKSRNYQKIIEELQKKKIPYIKQNYLNLKKFKKNPKIENIFEINLLRPRLFPFSKTEFELFFGSNNDNGLFTLAKKFVDETDKKNSEIFQQEFYKKSTFMLEQDKSLYIYINNEQEISRMLFLDFLCDFLQKNNIDLKHTLCCEKIIKPLLIQQEKKKLIAFHEIIAIILGLENEWNELFHIIIIFFLKTNISIDYDKKFIIEKEESYAKLFEKYSKFIFKELESSFKNKNLLHRCHENEIIEMLINIVFHMERFSKMRKNLIPNIFFTLRNLIVFLENFNPKHSSSNFRTYLNLESRNYNEERINLLSFLKTLPKQKLISKNNLLIEFEANFVFKEWYENQPDELFVEFLCERMNDNVIFAHNSVPLITDMLLLTEINFENLNFDNELHNLEQKHISNCLLNLVKDCKEKSFADNVSILVVNIFMHLLISKQKYSEEKVVEKYYKSFNFALQEFNNGVKPLTCLLIIAFTKYFLINYIDCLIKKQDNHYMVSVDESLSQKIKIAANCRFFCLKILRKTFIMREILEEFIKKKRVKWTSFLEHKFKEESSKSIIVPSLNIIPVSTEMKKIIASIIESNGSIVDCFEALFTEATKSIYNMYALFSFFLRFYYSLFYDEKNYKQKFLETLNKKKEIFEQIIGVFEFSILEKYSLSNFCEKYKITEASQFKEEIIVALEPFNWLIATKKCISPLHSLFFTEAAIFHECLPIEWSKSFVPGGIENPFINIAYGIINLLKGNFLGIYICSDNCDYIYSHGDCGWPSEKSSCPMCKKDIGRGTASHSIARSNEGGRRLMVQSFESSFYVYYMQKLEAYWEIQRMYVEEEINRMKEKKEIILNEKQQKITGLIFEDCGRISKIGYKIIKYILETLLYSVLSLGVCNEKDFSSIFEKKEIKEVCEELEISMNKNLQEIKNVLNLNNKFYGWMYGIQRNIFIKLINFPALFKEYQKSIDEKQKNIRERLLEDINQSKIEKKYHELYKALAVEIENGLSVRHILKITDYTAKNRFSRDFLEKEIDEIVKEKTNNVKFKFADESQELQGNMQFPYDAEINEDVITPKLEEEFFLAKVYKTPDKEISFEQIENVYEVQITEQYPFLDFLLKSKQMLQIMNDFGLVITFCNAIWREVENVLERSDSEKPLEIFIKELENKRGNSLNKVLKNSFEVIKAWNRLANILGNLQNECVPVGVMNNEMSMNSPIKSFILDSSTRRNPCGHMVSAIFHNFAMMHNSFLSQLNSKKNLIPKYKKLNLINEIVQKNPQQIQEKDIFIITEREFKEEFFKNSISSIVYGENYIFNNFSAYEEFFIIRLNEKCFFKTNVEEFQNICYNGEAFSRKATSSNILTELKKIFYVLLSEEEEEMLRRVFSQEIELEEKMNQLKKLRGGLEKTMVVMNKTKIYSPQEKISSFINKSKIEVNEILRISPFNELLLQSIVPLYEFIEISFKEVILNSLDSNYKEFVSNEILKKLSETLASLPINTNEENISLNELRTALFRFISRILISGIEDPNKELMINLTSREDFWTVELNETQKEFFSEPAFAELQFKHLKQTFDIVNELIEKS